MISFAQCFEDVLLWRALATRVHHSVGFWIDAGAFDPVSHSVTKVFSDHQWRGVNIEPIRAPFQRLVEQRPRDVNLQVLVSDHEGSEMFYEVENEQLSTTNSEFAERHARAGNRVDSYEVKTTTLTKVCETYAPDQIHFLKVDVEGNEASAIRGMDFNRFRPWILVMEATEPNRHEALTHHEWEHMLSAAGYQHVHTHLPNRYYVANEHSELKPCFSFPVDEYHRADELSRIDHLERELRDLRGRLGE